MRIEILEDTREDLLEGFLFYEDRQAGIGMHFLESLFSDIDTLAYSAGVHQVVLGYHRLLSRRFPFAIYYKLDSDVARVYAILDCRRNPAWIRRRLGPDR